jgi:hypothetical protein
VIAWYLFTGKARRLLPLIGVFLLGVLALSAAVVGWFALKGALPDLWQAYFVNNLTEYSHNTKSGRYDAPLPNLLNNLPWSVPGVFGLLWMAARLKKYGWEALAGWLSALCLFVFTYWNGRRYPYYALVLAVFAPFGLAGIASAAAWALKRIKPAVKNTAAATLACLLLPAGPLIALRASPNTYLMDYRREDLPQYRFAEIITQCEDPSLLNYGFLDGGFYFASGVLPSDPYFCTLNIDLPEMDQALRESIREGKTAFVVTRSQKLKGSSSYTLVDEADLPFEGRTWHYYLYQRK